MTETPGNGGTRRWLKVLLFASLALNLAIAGLVAGAVLRGGPPGHHRPPPDVAGAAPYMIALDHEQRRALWRELRGNFRRPPPDDLSRSYAEAVALLKADPFDAAAFSTLLETQAAAAEARRRTGQRALTDLLAGLPATERQAYAERLEARLEDFAERFRGRRDD